MGNTNRKCGPDHPSRGEHRVLTTNKQQYEESPADVIIIQQPQQGIITQQPQQHLLQQQHQQQQHNLTKSIKHMTRALMSQQHSQPHQQQQRILANKSKSENTVYIPGIIKAKIQTKQEKEETIVTPSDPQKERIGTDDPPETTVPPPNQDPVPIVQFAASSSPDPAHVPGVQVVAYPTD